MDARVVGLSICLASVSCTANAQSQPAGSSTTALPTIDVFAPTPLAGAGTNLDVNKFPAAVSIVTPTDIQRTESLSVTDALQQRVPGIIAIDVAGNPFQPDIQFRGFTASPVAGTPQGLAVYQNGMRINEAFGDTVNWDFIPTTAIKYIDVISNNPAFGLNAIGGALNIQMKDGFTYQGAEVSVMGGSFGRAQGSAQWGVQADKFAIYGALEGAREDGYRDFSGSVIRRFYGDVGYKTDSSEFHVNMGAAHNWFGAAAAVPVELLQARGWGATYTTPQTMENRVGYLNFTGKADVSPTWTVEGSARVRVFDQRTQDGNPTEVERCGANLLCFGDNGAPANGLNGMQLTDTFPGSAVLGENDRTTTRSTSTGLTLQATNTDQLFGFNNRFVVGGSLDYGVTHFGASAELGTIGSDYVVSGSGVFLGRSGDPIAIGPVSLRTTNLYTGLYALDTLDLTDRFSVTAGGRFNTANIKLEDQLGGDLNGNNNFARFNPLAGATYKINSDISIYGGYSEANRAPTPLELGCADPNRPCIIGAFLIADPPLKQVVSHTVEAGFKGNHDFGAGYGTLNWKLGVFRTDNKDDILAIPSPDLQGFGFFQNVGATRREGVEAQINIKSGPLQLFASYAYVDARFRDPLTLASNSPSADDDGNIFVIPGNHIPGIPKHRIKASIDYAVTDAFKLGADMLFVSNQFFIGDDSNQQPELPGYATFNLRGTYQIDKTFQIFARVDNLFDRRYATLGTFFEKDDLPNFANGGADFTSASTVTPARPRAFYAGLRAKF
ncbi:TonB-dependent receptor [Bradyrhizobium sp. SYSU BS000235]|uniref:TonB-dependent receptor n=1 Tax=Bradyrhizobium sp. SYSU BS000235 TaxID=3411332 RepID=UPI003C7541C8